MNKKGIFNRIVDMGIGLIVLIVIILLIYNVVKPASESTSIFTGSWVSKSVCTLGKDETSVSGDIDTAGNDFWEKLARCGYCLEKNGNTFTIYLTDRDNDGLPDKCEQPGQENNPPEQGASFADECISGYYKEYKNKIGVVEYKYMRCCIGFSDEDKEKYPGYCNQEK